MLLEPQHVQDPLHNLTVQYSIYKCIQQPGQAQTINEIIWTCNRIYTFHCKISRTIQQQLSKLSSKYDLNGKFELVIFQTS